jgi:hypothetical protein
MKDLLGMSGLEDAEEPPEESSHKKRRRDPSQISQAQPTRKNKWRYTSRLFGTNSLKDEVM